MFPRMKMPLYYFLVFLGCQSAILRSKDLQMDISSGFPTPRDLLKTTLIDKDWSEVEKVFKRITPSFGLFENKQTNEIILETKENSVYQIEISEIWEDYARNNEFEDVRNPIEDKDWNKTFCIFSWISMMHQGVRDGLVSINEPTERPQMYENVSWFQDFVEALAEIVDVEARMEYGDFPVIIVATMYENIEVLKILLARPKADPNLKIEDGRTALHFAAEIDLMELLWEHGAEIDSHADNWGTPLMHAVFREKYDSVKFLLEHKANPKLRESDGKTALHTAAESDRVDIIEILLDYGAEIDPTDCVSRTPLVCAVVETGLFQVVNALLEHKANPNLKDDSGFTALHYAAEVDRVDLMEILWEHGAEMDETDLSTPLMSAVYWEKYDSVKFLLEHKANPKLKDKDGKTALHEAANSDRVDLMEILWNHGAEIDETYSDLSTPLMYAVYCKKYNPVKFLLEHKANPKLKDIEGRTALHRAAESDSVDIIELLLDYDAEIDSTDDCSCTPLMSAVLFSTLQVVNALLEHGANPNLKNKAGLTALQYAIEVEIVEILVAHGAESDETDSDLIIRQNLLARGLDIDLII